LKVIPKNVQQMLKATENHISSKFSDINIF